MSGSQYQKERKTASNVTTTFFGQKITTNQIRFYNDHYPSRIDEWNNNEYMKMTILATHRPEIEKFVPLKIASRMTYFRKTKTKIKNFELPWTVSKLTTH